MPTGYFSTDTQLDVIESIEAALEYSERVAGDPRKWKWLVIALHSAIQGAMVLVLERGNGLQALKERSRAQWLKAYYAPKDQPEVPLPEVQLNYFLELYEDIKSDAARPYVHSRSFVSETRHDESMRKLNDLRNNWIHFTPKSWSIEVLYVARATVPVLELLSFLLTESQAFFWRDAVRADTAKLLVESLGTKLRDIETAESVKG